MPDSFIDSPFELAPLRHGIALLYCDDSRGAAEWRGAHLNSVLRLVPFTMLANIGSCVFAWWSFGEQVPSGMVLWAFVVCGFALLTLARWWPKRHHVVRVASRRAVRRATWHAAALAMVWMVMPVVWFAGANPEQQVTIGALTTGMMGVGALVLSPLPLASLAYSGVYAVAAIFGLIRTGDPAFSVTIGMMLLYAPVVVIGSLSSWHKASVQLAMQARATRREQLLAVLLQDFEQHADEALWETDRDGYLIHASDRLVEVTGIVVTDIQRLPFVELLSGRGFRVGSDLRNALADGHAFRNIGLSLDGPARVRHLIIRGKPLLDESGRPGGWRGVLADVTERIESEQLLVRQARTDFLTGLANRFMLRETLAGCARDGGAGALLAMDLDHFKAINDAMGHVMGDALLEAVAGRMRRCVREGDVLARTGGDEFALVMKPPIGMDEAQAMARCLIESVRQPVELGDRTLSVTLSLGYVTWSDSGISMEDALLRADTALYAAKAEGRDRETAYTADLGIRARRRRLIEEGLREAVSSDHLALYWQPKVDIDSNRIVGAEALLRWTHPELGPVMPAEFVPIAEQSGLIDALGAWALQEACRVGAGALRGMDISVNVSIVQLRGGQLPGQVREAIEKSGIDPGRLELELTESVFLGDPEASLLQLNAVRALGVSIALDDFGTGYSSLAYLRRFPFSTVKIDRAFIADMTVHRQARLLVQAIVDMAHAIGLHTICEGVETDQQRDAVRNAGCREFQGYLASRPCPIEDLLAFCQDWRRRDGRWDGHDYAEQIAQN